MAPPCCRLLVMKVPCRAYEGRQLIENHSVRTNVSRRNDLEECPAERSPAGSQEVTIRSSSPPPAAAGPPRHGRRAASTPFSRIRGGHPSPPRTRRQTTR